MGVKIKASITFLGTGQGSFVVGRNILSSGGFILQVDENQFHVDPGPNSLKNAAQNNINLRANTALLVSHSHLSHSNDVNAVIDAMTYSGLDKKGVLIANSATVNGDESLPAPLKPHYRDLLERFIVLKAGQRVGINEIEVLALKAKHSDPSTIGFKFFTPYFTISYSSDTRYFSGLIEEYKNSNVLILNVPNEKREESEDNLCVEDAIKIISGVSPRLAIIQHFGIKMVKSDLLYQIREIQKATNIQTILAKDGMMVNPLSYSVDLGQRTLSFPSKESPEEKEDVPVEEARPETDHPEEGRNEAHDPPVSLPDEQSIQEEKQELSKEEDISGMSGTLKEILRESD
ncbi:hypothetical protein KY358_07145 [Candidatus Woesearchaeota archaeon]|nr:hypothetical protein [Candidatus Woesearchaeota archaeon]